MSPEIWYCKLKSAKCKMQNAKREIVSREAPKREGDKDRV